MDIIRKAFAAFARRDLPAMQELLDPDVQFMAPTAELAHGGEPYRGLAGMQEYFADVERVWDELRLTPESFRQEGDVVLVTGRVWGLGGGQVVDSSAGWHWRVRAGRVVYVRAFRSAPQAERALADL
ncbi:MAG TPA: nuclear transport factor 2 family protein [Thermoleophilaceae bacterium]|nr:nuclear transport factor 2 family protein [Thermoleophilaceae bacterium]